MTKHEVSTIKQIAEMNESEQGRFILDLIAWLRFIREADKISGFRPVTDRVVWYDDGKVGEINKMVIVRDGAAGVAE